MDTGSQTPKTIPGHTSQAITEVGILSHLHRYGWRSTAFYRVLLWGPVPAGVRFSVPEVWPGNPDVGRELLKGHFCFQGECHSVAADSGVPQEASREWLAWYHGHGWLKDIRALASSEAATCAREYLSVWLDDNALWSELPWKPEVAAERLINWCQNWSFLCQENATSDNLTKALRQRAGTDARHILKATPPPTSCFERLHTIKGQVYGAYALLGGDGRMARALSRLELEIATQVLPDGGHIERSPERLTEVLKDLLELRALLKAATGNTFDFLQNAIDRVAPMVRALRYPDGGLAVFNGGLENDPIWLDQLLAHTETTSKAPQSAPHTGFQRLQAGDIHLVMDCHKPTPAGHLQHAGTLGFELSIGKQRLFVNCGARKGQNDPWRTALAATAAHTCLSVNDSSSATFKLDGTLLHGPQTTTCERQDIDQGALVEASHDGYLDTFALTHHRAIFVASHGIDVRGEDRLIGTGGNYFALRFHLHPKIKASLLGDSQGVMLRLPNNDVWWMRSSIADIKLESSVYLGTYGKAQRTEQIVISGPLSGNGALIKWALTRKNEPV
ncbi:MAG: heparinase II/III family protein [Magnetovibrio sp.]|nr:heparinase II/III family protein [Magnetovibrio sp.]